jgi:hypothetical protein
MHFMNVEKIDKKTTTIQTKKFEGTKINPCINNKYFIKQKNKSMTKNFKSISAFLMLAATSVAQKPTQEDDINRLMYLNSLYLQSYVHSDTATFDQLLWAEEFTQTNPDGSIFSREENLIRFGNPRFDKIIYFYGDEIKITFLKENVAEIYVRNPSGFLINGKVEKSVSWYKDTYEKRNGEWKCVSAVIKDNPF